MQNRLRCFAGLRLTRGKTPAYFAPGARDFTPLRARENPRLFALPTRGIIGISLHKTGKNWQNA